MKEREGEERDYLEEAMDREDKIAAREIGTVKEILNPRVQDFLIAADRIFDMFTDSMFREEELDSEGKPSIEMVIGTGIFMNAGFHPGRLSSHKEEVKEILGKLDPKFKEGYSFLSLPFDKDERQWGEHQNAEQLMILATAMGLMKLCIEERALWNLFPGGMPYLQIVEEDDEQV